MGGFHIAQHSLTEDESIRLVRSAIDRGITFLIVEHDLDFVMRAADRVVVMNEGRVLVVGSPDEVRTNEQVVDAYLGKAH